jgi:hypothetical protein
LLDSANNDHSSLRPVPPHGVTWVSLCVLMQLLDDPWGTYSNDDIAAAVPTLQVLAFHSSPH